MKPSAARLRQADEHSKMFIEPTMSTCLQTILSEVSQKMSVVPVIMSRVSDKSKLQFLPSIGFILNQLHAAVVNINNSNNYNNNVNNNFTWDNSHDYPVYDECDDFLDISKCIELSPWRGESGWRG